MTVTDGADTTYVGALHGKSTKTCSDILAKSITSFHFKCSNIHKRECVLKIATHMRGSQSVQKLFIQLRTWPLVCLRSYSRSGLELRADSIGGVWQEFPCIIYRWSVIVYQDVSF